MTHHLESVGYRCCHQITDANVQRLQAHSNALHSLYRLIKQRDSDCASLVTLNTLSLEVTVHYPFHPCVNRTFNGLQRSGSVHSQITLEHSPGKTFTIPIWMTDPKARDFCMDVSINIEKKRGRYPFTVSSVKITQCQDKPEPYLPECLTT
jgi:hypothetical protein